MRFFPILLLIAAPLFAANYQNVWGTETYNLEAGESIQFKLDSDDIKLRNWVLDVDGDTAVCDLHIRHLKSGDLVYSQQKESKHLVEIPWGIGEEISVAIIADSRNNGLFTIRFLGPQEDEVKACYSFKVNRAIEAYESGDKQKAESLCREAVKDNPKDQEAILLLQGFHLDKTGKLKQPEKEN